MQPNSPKNRTAPKRRQFENVVMISRIYFLMLLCDQSSGAAMWF